MSQELAYKVEVKGARGLLPMDPNGASDPYCLYGLADPETLEFIDPSNVIRSKTHFVTLTPIWKGLSLIAKSTEHKIRIEIWDKDQDVDDDFEGLAMIDLSTIESDFVESWLPLTGRTPEENVTGDVNVVITRAPLQELELGANRRNSGAQAQIQEMEKLVAAQKEDQRTIKRLQADLKTRSGKLELIRESSTVLDQQLVKAKQQIELLQTELSSKTNQLESHAEALVKTNTYVIELQKALQEKQSVSKLAKEWDDNAALLAQLQASLKAKSLQHRKTSPGKVAPVGKVEPVQETTEISEKETEWLSVGKVMEQWHEYTSLIEALEADLNEKSQQAETIKLAHEQQLHEATQTIEKLQSELTTQSQLFEKFRVSGLEQTQQLRDSSQAIENLKVALQQKSEQATQLEQITVDLRVAEKRKREVEGKELEEALETLRTTNAGLEQRRHDDEETIQLLRNELAKKSGQLESLRVEHEERVNAIAILEEERKVRSDQTKAQDDAIERLQAEVKEKSWKLETLGALEEERQHERETLELRNEQLQAEKISSDIRVEQLSQQIVLNEKAYAKLEKDLKQTRESMLDDLDVKVARPTKHVHEQELKIHETGRAEFSSRITAEEREPLAQQVPSGATMQQAAPQQVLLSAAEPQEKGGDSVKDLRQVGTVELEELETARRTPTVPLLGEEGLLPSLPSSYEVARAKKKRFCC